jgi:hypothetical protein
LEILEAQFLNKLRPLLQIHWRSKLDLRFGQLYLKRSKEQATRVKVDGEAENAGKAMTTR